MLFLLLVTSCRSSHVSYASKKVLSVSNVLLIILGGGAVSTYNLFAIGWFVYFLSLSLFGIDWFGNSWGVSVYLFLFYAPSMLFMIFSSSLLSFFSIFLALGFLPGILSGFSLTLLIFNLWSLRLLWMGCYSSESKIETWS